MIISQLPGRGPHPIPDLTVGYCPVRHATIIAWESETRVRANEELRGVCPAEGEDPEANRIEGGVGFIGQVV